MSKQTTPLSLPERTQPRKPEPFEFAAERLKIARFHHAGQNVRLEACKARSALRSACEARQRHAATALHQAHAAASRWEQRADMSSADEQRTRLKADTNSL